MQKLRGACTHKTNTNRRLEGDGSLVSQKGALFDAQFELRERRRGAGMNKADLNNTNRREWVPGSSQSKARVRPHSASPLILSHSHRCAGGGSGSSSGNTSSNSSSNKSNEKHNSRQQLVVSNKSLTVSN